MGKPNFTTKGLFGMAIVAAVLLFATIGVNTAVLARADTGMYYEGSGEFTSIPSNQIVTNEDGTRTIISADEAAEQQQQEQTATTTNNEDEGSATGHIVDQDLDCPDYFERGLSNMSVSSVDEAYQLDGDNDGQACEITSNGTRPADDVVVTNTANNTICYEINIAQTLLQNGDVIGARIHIQNAITITQAMLPEQPLVGPGTEQPPEVNTIPIYNENQSSEVVVLPEPDPQNPVGQVQGNALYVDQLNLEAAGVLGDCPCVIEALQKASIIIFIGQLIEANPDNAQAIIDNNQTIADTITNNTEIIGDIVGPIVENADEIAANQTTIEEVVEGEVAPSLEDELDQISVTDAGDITLENLS